MNSKAGKVILEHIIGHETPEVLDEILKRANITFNIEGTLVSYIGNAMVKTASGGVIDLNTGIIGAVGFDKPKPDSKDLIEADLVDKEELDAANQQIGALTFKLGLANEIVAGLKEKITSLEGEMAALPTLEELKQGLWPGFNAGSSSGNKDRDSQSLDKDRGSDSKEPLKLD